MQELHTEFIARQQKLLSTDPDAFYRSQGSDAFGADDAATDRLQALKAEVLDRDTVPPAVRKRLAPLLDTHISLAGHGITRHVARQSMEWEKSVVAGRQTVLHQQATLRRI